MHNKRFATRTKTQEKISSGNTSSRVPDMFAVEKKRKRPRKKRNVCHVCFHPIHEWEDVKDAPSKCLERRKTRHAIALISSPTNDGHVGDCASEERNAKGWKYTIVRCQKVASYLKYGRNRDDERLWYTFRMASMMSFASSE